jgi:hypothetical protein
MDDLFVDHLKQAGISDPFTEKTYTDLRRAIFGVLGIEEPEEEAAFLGSAPELFLAA